MFYAEENPYGIGATTEVRRKLGNTLRYRPVIVTAGSIHRFETREARDAFVTAAPMNGHRDTARAVTRREAIRLDPAVRAGEWVECADGSEYCCGPAY